MANDTIFIPIPDVRQGPIKRIVTRVMAGDEHVYIRSSNLFDIPQIFCVSSYKLRLDTGADVGNRIAKLLRYFKDIDLQGIISGTVTASSAGVMTAIKSSYPSLTGNWNSSAVGISEGFFIVDNETYLDNYISGGFAGDSWYAIYEFKYMNREYGMPEVLPEQEVK